MAIQTPLMCRDVWVDEQRRPVAEAEGIHLLDEPSDRCLRELPGRRAVEERPTLGALRVARVRWQLTVDRVVEEEFHARPAPRARSYRSAPSSSTSRWSGSNTSAVCLARVLPSTSSNGAPATLANASAPSRSAAETRPSPTSRSSTCGGVSASP